MFFLFENINFKKYKLINKFKNCYDTDLSLSLTLHIKFQFEFDSTKIHQV